MVQSLDQAKAMQRAKIYRATCPAPFVFCSTVWYLACPIGSGIQSEDLAPACWAGGVGVGTSGGQSPPREDQLLLC